LQEITGKLPKEYPLEKGEEIPTTRRIIGASYQFNKIPTGQVAVNPAFTSNSHIYASNSAIQQDLERLNIDYDIQSKITNAAFLLASDPSASKAIRKQRKDFYEKANEKVTRGICVWFIGCRLMLSFQLKLLKIENKINETKFLNRLALSTAVVLLLVDSTENLIFF
jgi:hypothetical protein